LPESVLVSRRDALAGATAALTAAGCDTPRLDAELLLAGALGVGRERLVLDASMGLDGASLAGFNRLVARRAAREPVAYILARKEFRWISLAVDSRALIPRPETELLVEVGSTLPAGSSVVDVGTGSGAIALALKHERPDLSVWGTDVSADALALASENARRLELDVQFVQADLLEGVPHAFDGVLANLPYVPEEAMLAPEIADYEPAQALFAGPDGLDLVRRLVPMLAGVQLVGIEIGFGQESGLGVLLREAGFSSVECLRDLAGHERVVVGRR